VVEDCAHALGSEYKGKKCGTIGDIGCFSFYSNKNMTTGEGGMIITDNDELASRIKLMRSHGMTSMTLDRHEGRAFSYDVVELGYNYRIDEIRSAIGIVQLEKLKQDNLKRKELSRLYMEKLAGIDKLKILIDNNSNTSAYHIFPILLDKEVDRQGFMEDLKNNGIQTSIHYPPSHLFDFYRRNYGYREGSMPVTETVAKREVTLPLYPLMCEGSIDYICDSIVECMEQRRN